MPPKLLKGQRAIDSAKQSLNLQEVQQFENELERAAYLIANKIEHRDYFLQLWPNQKCKLDRAIRAVKQCRDVGIDGRPPKLNKSELKTLEQTIEKDNILDEPVSKTDINDYANNLIDARGPLKDVNRMKHVVSSFAFDLERRLENLKKTKVSMKELYRILAETQEALRPMFDWIEILFSLNDYNLGLVFNFDEKPLRLSLTLSTYLFTVGEHIAPSLVAPPRHKNATLVLCIASDGDHLCTFLLWPGATLPIEFTNSINSHFRVICGSGWMTIEILSKQVMPVWIKQIQEKKELRMSLGLCTKKSRSLMICDSHKSRASLEMIKTMRDADIDLSTIVPHSSGVCQPCDLGPNALLQIYLDLICGWSAGNSASEYRMQLIARIPERLRNIEIKQEYGFPIGNKTLTDPAIIIEWENLLIEKEKKKNEKNELKIAKANARKEKKEKKENIKKEKKEQRDALKKDRQETKQRKQEVGEIDSKMKQIVKKNKSKRVRITEKEDEILDESEDDDYEDGYLIQESDDNVFQDQSESSSDSDSESIDEEAFVMENDETSSEEEGDITIIPQKRKRQSRHADAADAENSTKRVRKPSKAAKLASKTVKIWKNQDLNQQC